MQSNALPSIAQSRTRPMSGDALSGRDKANKSNEFGQGGRAKPSLDAAYLKRTNSYAFELNLSEPAQAIIAELNAMARAKQGENDRAQLTETPATASPLQREDILRSENTKSTREASGLPPTILESYGPFGERAQAFLREFFDGAGETSRQYQDKIGRLVDSMNGGQHMVELDMLSEKTSLEDGHTVFSMQAINGSRMRIFMQKIESQSHLTITYLNRETGSYDLDMVKQPNISGTPLVEQNLVSSETVMVKIHEVGRRIIQGCLHPEPEYDNSALFRFK